MQSHVPVLLKEVVENIIKSEKAIYIDCTLGEGGHALNILKNSKKGSFLIGIDQDIESIIISKKIFKNIFNENSYKFINSNFVNIKKEVEKLGINKVDGIFYDLGFVANQLYSFDRGFSYRFSEKLDMRMNKFQFLTAEIILNNYSEKELTKIFKEYGEEKYSARIAYKIIQERKKNPIIKTSEFIKIIKSALNNKDFLKKHPARKIFQALRIAVNNEFDVLENSLISSFELLKNRGKLLIISYHSLEDKIIKNFFNSLKNIKIINKKPIIASKKEKELNRQSRSAKLRIIQKINE